MELARAKPLLYTWSAPLRFQLVDVTPNSGGSAEHQVDCTITDIAVTVVVRTYSDSEAVQDIQVEGNCTITNKQLPSGAPIGTPQNLQLVFVSIPNVETNLNRETCEYYAIAPDRPGTYHDKDSNVGLTIDFKSSRHAPGGRLVVGFKVGMYNQSTEQPVGTPKEFGPLELALAK